MFTSRKSLYAFTRKVYKRLKGEHFMVRFFRNKAYHGMCYPGANWIELNPKGEILSTICHECLHDIYPDWTEERVLAMERLVMHNLSHRQMVNIMVALGDALKRGLIEYNKLGK